MYYQIMKMFLLLCDCNAIENKRIGGKIIVETKKGKYFIFSYTDRIAIQEIKTGYVWNVYNDNDNKNIRSIDKIKELINMI